MFALEKEKRKLSDVPMEVGNTGLRGGAGRVCYSFCSYSRRYHTFAAPVPLFIKSICCKNYLLVCRIAISFAVLSEFLSYRLKCRSFQFRIFLNSTMSYCSWHIIKANTCILYLKLFIIFHSLPVFQLK